MLIKLKGKTRHGVNRIHEHGEVWQLSTEVANDDAIVDRVMFSSKPGPWMLLQSLRRKTYVQWVNRNDDEDFLIESFS